jgi:hypothetical protein
LSGVRNRANLTYCDWTRRNSARWMRRARSTVDLVCGTTMLSPTEGPPASAPS